MSRKNQLTEFGLEVKHYLLKNNISQKEFCESLQIPQNRFSEIIHGVRPGEAYQQIIAKHLKEVSSK